MSDRVIQLESISKGYKRYVSPAQRLRDLILPGHTHVEEFWALRDIDLEVTKGETVGIIGRNGSGKSTLLQIVVGTSNPTHGKVQVNGRVSALLELGSGFNPEFTGRQNVYFNGRILGLTEEQIAEKFEDIVAFADIGDFVDQPVRTYSSGMYVRLAFSVAVNVDPEILVVDEALSVGDARFQQRCMSRIKRMRDTGISILFVSHDAEAVKRLCDHVVVLEGGRIVNRGNALHMTNWYLALTTVDFNLQAMKNMEQRTDAGVEMQIAAIDPEPGHISELINEDIAPVHGFEPSNHVDDDARVDFEYFRHGDANARITDVRVKNGQGKFSDIVFMGDTISIEVEVTFVTDQPEHLIGFYIRDRFGTDIIGINTYQERITLPPVNAGDSYLYRFEFPIDLRPGVYSISPSVAYNQFDAKWMDWIENAVLMRVIDRDRQRLVFGLCLPPKRKVRIEQVDSRTAADSPQAHAE